ncbi:dTDP-4-dehydrorhamnose 3,5-epimerase [candidate division WOR-1 bacterium RIFOXYD2_FULL_36_8]|uniref:dTDP-4-dehydrorhamnose 3,5-epimerase n=1 Tax=candidate division WOR-1 bacterium RIFOXYB2_FULL_36_35 TaxID=1802578 RepID=A0A1F4S3J7_UNCSA|nr:MAG: dTDP-4-dehydrorhamnose 3,5-epimerase [candidate division WOR-1 bacterium RIFOXYA2_FULL_36_21]OGC15006.1 MAG: dTDP-4-dehydrorhamnose 3,5-epimerase [candidate division WOR-1 bacterium RIFOXYB2_FULL_36_35]OGC18713.1 MAG: dTDP-4-dehydrorhamnose 3,5-epimerase [candidate division WOR-1 bacterium RIFOXYA12_FULL_36_13]OGC39247.1 MAG: dTDP-4-dehydrorhamnose 3,5-epimerase [candidate division WOR-1 bacterium RIFOXYD2_FULL_36_8]
MKFKFSKTDISGVLVIEPNVYKDYRGFFMEYYNKDAFKTDGNFTDLFVQDNHSRSQKGVIRGLHYQLNPHAMGKLVKVVRGEAFDVGVDIRKGSKTFGKWYGEVLTAENHKMLYFPPGFAHGFLALTDNVEFLYKCTGMYNGPSERAIAWDDPDIGILWPLDKVDGKALLSDKDKKHPKLKEAEHNFI